MLNASLALPVYMEELLIYMPDREAVAEISMPKARRIANASAVVEAIVCSRDVYLHATRNGGEPLLYHLMALDSEAVVRRNDGMSECNAQRVWQEPCIKTIIHPRGIKALPSMHEQD